MKAVFVIGLICSAFIVSPRSARADYHPLNYAFVEVIIADKTGNAGFRYSLSPPSVFASASDGWAEYQVKLEQSWFYEGPTPIPDKWVIPHGDFYGSVGYNGTLTGLVASLALWAGSDYYATGWGMPGDHDAHRDLAAILVEGALYLTARAEVSSPGPYTLGDTQPSFRW